MARATGFGEWPNIEPVSPRQKSSNSLPSISAIVAPLARSTRIGNGVGQSFIQCIGTPPKKPGSPLPKARAELGRALRYAAASRSRNADMRASEMPPWIAGVLFKIAPCYRLSSQSAGLKATQRWPGPPLQPVDSSLQPRCLLFIHAQMGDHMRFFILAAALIAAAPVHASGGLWCDNVGGPVKISIQSGVTRGMGFPVFDFRASSEVDDATIGDDLRKTTFEGAHLPQYWFHGEDLNMVL